MRLIDPHASVLAITILIATSFPHELAFSQGASASFTGTRLFVTGFTPVIGRNGSVGGIDVSPEGVLQRAVTTSELDNLRRRAVGNDSNDIDRESRIRKVSLAKLESEIARRRESGETLSADMLFLAGLQRVEYLFVYPESNDIVIAGPAEGWEVHGDTVIGASSRKPVLRLDDLIDALQSGIESNRTESITCSINPTEQGMIRLQRLLSQRDVRLSDEGVEQMEQTLGDQNVTLTGIRPTSHFARVMVGADYMMKRIAMGLEPSPVAGLPSYMQLLQGTTRSTQVTTPRWWLATDYRSVERSPDDLAWHFHGRGVRTESEHAYLDHHGQQVNTGRPTPLAKSWADKFTSNYDALAESLPVFGQLSGCVDLAMVAALIWQQDLRQRADCPLSMLTDPTSIRGEAYVVAKTVPSRASLIRSRRGWVVSVSGGVDLTTEQLWSRAKTNRGLAEARRSAPPRAALAQSAPPRSENWWWD